MEYSLYSKGILEFQKGLPENYRGNILNSAVAYSAKSNLTELIIQELSGEGYKIRYIVGNFLKSLSTSTCIVSHGLYNLFMLKNGAQKSIEKVGEFHLRQDQYTSFITSTSHFKAVLEKPTEFQLLEIFYTPELLLQMAPYFPQIKEIVSATSIFLTSSGLWTLPSMKEIFNQILNCPYDEQTRKLYYDLKIREMLFQILTKAYKKEPDLSFSPYEKAKIIQAKEILENCIDSKPPTIKQLARRVAINENKLKIGFRTFFNSGIFEWIIEQKMNYAKHLIKHTDKPIKEIAASVGYPRTTNFITAFRKRFGFTPGSLRR